MAFNLQPFTGERGDATLCDSHAGLKPEEMKYIRSWMARGIQAGLIGSQVEQGVPSLIWAVADTGWIFEARLTNAGQSVYHGYPVLPGNPVAQFIYDRFRSWVLQHTKARHQAALQACREWYGFRP